MKHTEEFEKEKLHEIKKLEKQNNFLEKLKNSNIDILNSDERDKF
jgi:hypothetical protein